MRDLVRPTLFFIARLGLFLAVVAWIVGQTWQGVGSAYWIIGAIDQSGIGIAISASPDWSVGLENSPDRAKIQDFLDGVQSGPNVLSVRLHVAAVQLYPSLAIGMQHWLIVTLSAMFYGAVSFFHRERTAIPRCDV